MRDETLWIRERPQLWWSNENYQRPENFFFAKLTKGVATGKLFSWKQGELLPRRPKKFWLSEALAPQNRLVI